MTPKEYNAIKDPDTALAVRLAVTMGWKHVAFWKDIADAVMVKEHNIPAHMWVEFDPFTDARIPYGLIGRGINSVRRYEGGWIATEHLWHDVGQTYLMHEDKTTAILQGYCQADPNGHWAKFIGENE